MNIPETPEYLPLYFYNYIYYRKILELLIKKCAKRGLLLDAGCGKGGSIAFPCHDLDIVCIDIIRSNVEFCHKQWKNRGCIVADLTMLPFKDDVFCGVFSVDVLEHVKDKRLSIKEFARTTLKNGFFVGSSSNILNPILWLDVKLPLIMKPLEIRFAGEGNYHRHSRFSPHSLADALKSAGYQTNYLTILGFPMFSTMHVPKLIAFLWVFFDRITKKRPFQYLKEALVWYATDN